MAVEITTLATIKSILGITSATNDVIISRFVTQVSALIGTFIGRHVEQKDRTEFFRVERDQQLFFLKGYPVDTGQTFEVRNDFSRKFPTGSIIDADNYAVDDEDGILEIDRVTLESGPRSLRVQYTGGLATTTAGVTTAFPDLALAAEIQAKWLFKRKDDDGLTAVSAEGGSITAFPDLTLVPEVKRILESHRRILVA